MSEQPDEQRDETDGTAPRPATAAARRDRRASTQPPADAGPGKGRPTPSRDRPPAKGSPVRRLVRFLREVVAELRKVIWPARKELVTYTIVVLVFVSFMVALVAGVDVAFGRGVLYVFGN